MFHSDLPAVGNTLGPHPSASNRYRFLPTGGVIEALENAGFTVRSARQTGKTQFGFHVIEFDFPDMQGIEHLIGGDKVQLRGRFENSHDRRRAWALSLGIWRLVCDNGLVAMTEAIADLSTRHLGPNNVIDGMYRVIDESANVLTDMRTMASKELSDSEQKRFAAQAAKLRWNENPPIMSDQLLNVRRPEDAGDTVWQVYNRVQENLLRGGQVGQTRTNRTMTVRPVRSLLSDTLVNKKLWKLAQEFV